MATLKESIEKAAQNPETPFANELRRRIEAGEYNKLAEQEGLDFSGMVKEQPKESGLVEKAGNVLGKVFGGAKIGEALGTQIAKISVPKEQRQFIQPGPPASEVLGDVAGVALTVAGLKGASTVGGFGVRLLKSIGLGAGLGASQAIEEGGDIGETTKGAVTGGAIGAAIPVVGAGLKAVGRQVETLPARFVNSALSRSKKQVLNDIAKDKVDDFAQYVIKSKPIGTAKTLLNESMDSISVIDKKVNESLASAIRKSGSKVTLGRDGILDQVAKLPEAEGALLKRNDIKGIIEKLAPQTKKLLQKNSLTLEEANRLRSLVDKTLGDRGFLTSQLSSDKAVLKAFANNLRENVKSKAPEGIRELFSEYSNEIRFRDGLLEKIAQRAGNQVLSFGDFIGGGLGGIFGGGVPGAVAGVAARRAIESVPFKLSAAKLTNALTKLAPTLDSLAPAQQTAILNLFSTIFSPAEEGSAEETK